MSNVNLKTTKEALYRGLKGAEQDIEKHANEIVSDIKEKLRINETDSTDVTVSFQVKLKCNHSKGIEVSEVCRWNRPHLAKATGCGSAIDTEELKTQCESCNGVQGGCDQCGGKGYHNLTADPKPTTGKGKK